MKYDWKDLENNTSYFFKLENGLIIGQAHNVVHTKIWVAKIFLEEREIFLGHYISLDFSKKAIETFMRVEEKTLLDRSE